MAFAGNALCKLSIGLQCRVLLLPWMKRSGSIRHLSCRASSSFPVRYRPKKTLKTEEPQTMKGPEDEVLNNDLNQKAQRSGPSKSFPVKYHPKKTMKTEGPQISSIPTKVPVSEVMSNDPKKKDSIFEVANSFPARYQPDKTLKTEEPIPIKGLEDEEMKNDLNQNALRFEVSTSLSVRHHPKETLKAEEPRTSTTIKGHEDGVMNYSLNQKALSFVLGKNSQSQIGGPISYLAYNNNQVEEEINSNEGALGYEWRDEPKEVVKDLRILQGQIPQKDDALLAGKTLQDAEKLAVELLAARAFTAVELRKKLQAKRFPIHVINAVIIDFQSRGLINDCLYAETFSRSRWSSSSWGPRRIKQALFKKGVSEDDAQKAIKLVFQESDSSIDHEPRFGLSKTSMDHLFVQASKQWHRGRDVTDETRKARIIRWLQYRGFNWGVISFILKKLESECIP
ncbi:hypothetical protein NMG60_11002048 [Bertholletia excelsa]